MARDDWYRNTDWNDAIETEFLAKLARARDKQQYLKLQAGIIAQSHPRAALALLDRYFAMGENLFMAEALRAKAYALFSLGETDAAIDAFEAVLQREETHGNLLTQTRLDYPYLVVLHQLKRFYGRALELAEAELRDGLTFPDQIYKRNAVRALLHAERGEGEKAAEVATIAMQAARATHSGLARHPVMGLVDPDDPLRPRLEALLGAKPAKKGIVRAIFGRR